MRNTNNIKEDIRRKTGFIAVNCTELAINGVK
jgi:hypothetical protein